MKKINKNSQQIEMKIFNNYPEVIQDNPEDCNINNKNGNSNQKHLRKPRSKKISSKSFLDEVEKDGYHTDNKGIYKLFNEEIIYISNFNSVKFLYTLIDSESGNETRIRVVKINNIIFNLTHKDITSKRKFNQLLLNRSKFYFRGSSSDFQIFLEIILNLDNGLNIRELKGSGKVHEKIVNLGNIILRKRHDYLYSEIVWLGKQGYKLASQKNIEIDINGFDLPTLWNKMHGIYKQYSYLIFGFSIATAFFREIISDMGAFPILYLFGNAGSGKSTLSELIGNLFGAKRNYFTVNCDSLSTPIGIEEKTQELNNLPLIMNEVSSKQNPYLRSRYDGDGSIKASLRKNNPIHERQVKCSTIAISVSKPLELQVAQRCIFLDISIVMKDKKLFDMLYLERSKLSTFIKEVLIKIKPAIILKDIFKFRHSVLDKGFSPRTIDNYSIIGGSLLAWIGSFKSNKFPSEKEVFEFILKEMEIADKNLNPLSYLIGKLRMMINNNIQAEFLTWDNELIYLHLQGFWNYLPKVFKEKYYNKMGIKEVKKLFYNSEYIAIYGKDLNSSKNEDFNEPALSHTKKIEGDAKRCVVLIRQKV